MDKAQHEAPDKGKRNILVTGQLIVPTVITSFSLSAGQTLLSWDPPSAADQVQQINQVGGGMWEDVGPPTDVGSIVLPVLEEALLFRVLRP